MLKATVLKKMYVGQSGGSVDSIRKKVGTNVVHLPQYRRIMHFLNLFSGLFFFNDQFFSRLEL